MTFINQELFQKLIIPKLYLRISITYNMINIYLIVHASKKPEMVSFVMRNKEFLCRTKIFATCTAGSHFEKEGFNLEKLLSRSKGGDAQIAALLSKGDFAIVIFFRDHLDKHRREPDVQMHMRVCNVHNIPLATYPASQDIILEGIAIHINAENT